MSIPQILILICIEFNMVSNELVMSTEYITDKVEYKILLLPSASKKM